MLSSDLPLIHKDRDTLGECLGRLGVKAPSEFERVAVQFPATLTNDLPQLHQFIAQRLIAAFLLQARQEKVEIVLPTQQFAQRFRTVSYFLQNPAVNRLQNA